MIIRLNQSAALPVLPGWYFLGNMWHKFDSQHLGGHTEAGFVKMGYTHYFSGICCPKDAPEGYLAKQMEGMKTAHENTLRGSIERERDHQILIKKLKERITELELNPIPEIKWDQQKNFYIKETKTVEGYIPIWKYETMVDIATRNSESSSQYCRERDLARKTLDDVRALLNGQKI